MGKKIKHRLKNSVLISPELQSIIKETIYQTRDSHDIERLKKFLNELDEDSKNETYVDKWLLKIGNFLIEIREKQLRQSTSKTLPSIIKIIERKYPEHKSRCSESQIEIIVSDGTITMINVTGVGSKIKFSTPLIAKQFFGHSFTVPLKEIPKILIDVSLACGKTIIQKQNFLLMDEEFKMTFNQEESAIIFYRGFPYREFLERVYVNMQD